MFKRRDFVAIQVFILTVGLTVYSCSRGGYPFSLDVRSGATASSDAATRVSPERRFPHSGVTSGALELPFCPESTFVYYSSDSRSTILYDTAYRQAAWVAYILTRADVQAKNATRRDRFVTDPHVVAGGWPTARNSHYDNSGYDRGHLLPSADRTASQQENDATFRMSNISPQYSSLNRGPWKSLEERARAWAETHDSLYIATGGVLEPGLECIKGGVGVPEYFYKALLVKSGDEYRAAAFLMPNGPQTAGPWSSYIITVDSLETFTGIDFFHNLPDPLEDLAESRLDAPFLPLCGA